MTNEPLYHIVNDCLHAKKNSKLYLIKMVTFLNALSDLSEFLKENYNTRKSAVAVTNKNYENCPPKMTPFCYSP